MVRDQHGDGGAAALTTSAAQSGNNASSQDSDPNLKTLQDFQKTVQEEHKSGEKRIEEINANLEAVKKQIDEERSQLDDLRAKLKQVNEEKDADYPKFVELRNSLAEAKNQMKTFDDKVGGIVAAKSRKERLDIQNLSRSLEQIEKDIQTKKLSKEEERKLVSRSREIATKLHTLKLMHKKEDHFRNISSKYDGLKDKVRDIFRRKEEFGNRIGKLKESLSTLVNQRENLYEERRNVIHSVREATAKLEMIDTQLKAIQYKRTRMQAAEYRQRRQKESDERRVARQEAIQERAKRDKEYQDRWNTLKEAAMKKMSSGEKLTFDEMKLIFSDSDSD